MSPRSPITPLLAALAVLPRWAGALGAEALRAKAACLVPLLSLTALLCLSCALCTPAAAQPDSLTITRLDVHLTHRVHPDAAESWEVGVYATIFDPKGGDSVSRVLLRSPAGAEKELTRETAHPRSWVVDGNYLTVEVIFPDGPIPPEFGRYKVTAWNVPGDSHEVLSQPTDHLPQGAPTITSPSNGAVLTDTQPIFSWNPYPEASPYDITFYAIWLGGPSDEYISDIYDTVWVTDASPDAGPLSVRFNEDGTAGVPELTPGRVYDLTIFQMSSVPVVPASDGPEYESYTDRAVRGVAFTIASSSLTSFEEERYPWAGFAAGPDEAAIWREPFTPVGAHSATFAMQGETDGEAITGLRLALPVGTTQPAGASLRSWAYVPEWTGADSSCFFGFSLTEDYPDSTTGWSQAIGWEALSATQSNLQLGGTSIALPFGLPAAGWHLVRVNYHRGADSLRVWLDGVLVADEVDIGAAGQAPHYAVLGALGQSAAAEQSIRFDDVSILPMLDVPWPPDTHLFARVEGLEQVAEGHQYSYEIRYGNGYPVLGTEPLSEELADPMYVGVTLPAGYSFLESATPTPPTRVADRTLVWELLTPAFGQEGSISFGAQAPTDLPAPTTETLYLWVTDDPGAATSDPPNSPNWTSPCDATWGCPQDVLPQAIFLAEDLLPDLWVRKDGPRYASPGDTVNYAITVGNRGLAPATEVVVRDLLPELLGGDDVLLGEIAQLDPGDTWRGVIGEELPWGVEHGTLLLNLAYVPSAPAEVVFDNNESVYETTVLTAHDPNQISVSPEGALAAGDTLTYTIECENTGEGRAYGVYATMVLDPSLDDDTLALPAGVAYLSLSRTFVWNVGTLGPGADASISFTSNVAADAPEGAPIIGQAIIYFPSVPEVTPTNIVVNWVPGLFSDVPPDHWAYEEIMACVRAGIARGYPDGYYRPHLRISRDQMAVFISRALAGGDDVVPPEEPTFPDVPTDHWAYRYVEYAAANDIVEGYADGNYHPEFSLGRAQMAVFIARSIVTPAGEAGLADYTPPEDPSFLDVQLGFWAYNHIEYLAQNDVAGGYPEGYYRPTWTVSRAQMAVFISRAFDLPM